MTDILTALKNLPPEADTPLVKTILDLFEGGDLPPKLLVFKEALEAVPARIPLRWAEDMARYLGNGEALNELLLATAKHTAWVNENRHTEGVKYAEGHAAARTDGLADQAAEALRQGLLHSSEIDGPIVSGEGRITTSPEESLANSFESISPEESWEDSLDGAEPDLRRIYFDREVNDDLDESFDVPWPFDPETGEPPAEPIVERPAPERSCSFLAAHPDHYYWDGVGLSFCRGVQAIQEAPAEVAEQVETLTQYAAAQSAVQEAVDTGYTRGALYLPVVESNPHQYDENGHCSGCDEVQEMLSEANRRVETGEARTLHEAKRAERTLIIPLTPTASPFEISQEEQERHLEDCEPCRYIRETLREMNKDEQPVHPGTALPNSSSFEVTTTPAPTKQRPGDQVLPTVNDAKFIQDLVIDDIEARKQVGIERYGTALQPFNGRDSLQDLYEELIDGAMYAKQAHIEALDVQARLDAIVEVVDNYMDTDDPSDPEECIAFLQDILFNIAKIIRRKPGAAE